MAHQWQPAFDPQASEPDLAKKVLAVHLALLPTGAKGTLLYFSGNRWNATNHATGSVDYTALLDYESRAFTQPGSPTGPGGLAPSNFFDLFCSGHALLADGRLLVAGGTSLMQVNVDNPHKGHWGGLREAFIFDPHVNPPWQTAGPMNFCPLDGFSSQGGGRWYPSLVTLADGSVLALCGHPRIFDTIYDEADPSTYPSMEDDPRHNNASPDRFFLASNSWAQLNKDEPFLGECYLHDFAVFFPRVHVLPSRNLLIVQPLYTDDASSVLGSPPSATWGAKSLVYDPDTEVITAAFPGPQGLQPGYLHPGYEAQFTTSVLLPLDPSNGYRVSVLLCGETEALITTFDVGTEASASWVPTLPRQAFFDMGGSTVAPRRCNALATLLPTGDVLVTGGMTVEYSNSDQTDGVRVPELYRVSDGTWHALTDAPAVVPRGYHSTALLMLDGRVLTAGSEINSVFGTVDDAETRIELFEPDYITAPNRTTLTHNPPSVGYGDTFAVNYSLAPGGAAIAKVAVTRFGSATHAFDYDQRYVILEYSDAGPGQLSVSAPPDGGVAPPGFYMLWLIDSAGLPCVEAGVLRIGYQKMYAEMDREVFSIYDVQNNQAGGSGQPVYRRAFYAVFDGFIPNDIVSLSPSASFSQAGISAALSTTGGANPALELPGSPHLIQRMVFAFDLTFELTFAGLPAFSGMAPPDDLREVTVTITAGDYQCAGRLELVMEPSPYMVDGDPAWLSQDLRVFQVTPDNATTYLPGYTWVSPNDYITKLITYLNGNSTRGQNLFTTLEAVQSVPLLQLPTVDGTAGGAPIFSFGLARVRLDSSIDAQYVRVMFRLFRTMTPSLTYDTSTIYQRTVSPIQKGGVEVTEDAMPLLGFDGADLISIPFFADKRVAANQTDSPNRQDFQGAPGETTRFFGCWLDINQPNDASIQLPGAPQPHSIQELTVGTHQCMVAEVHYKYDTNAPDLPIKGDTPATSDKLSQRNLALTMTANPGVAATRTVQHTFEIKATATSAPRSVSKRRARAANAVVNRPPEGGEALVLWWDTIPRDTIVEIYLPGLPANEIIRRIPASHAQTLIPIDDHTLSCVGLGDCTFIPLPPSVRGRALSGLITLRLPTGIQHGQTFKLVGQQFSRAQRVVGAFELRVRVDRDHASLLILDKDHLAILKHQLQTTPINDRWHPLLSRMVVELGNRVAGFGADPHDVHPSPWGAGPHAPIQVGSRDDDGTRSGSWALWLILFLLLLVAVIVGIMLMM